MTLTNLMKTIMKTLIETAMTRRLVARRERQVMARGTFDNSHFSIFHIQGEKSEG